MLDSSRNQKSYHSKNVKRYDQTVSGKINFEGIKKNELA